MSSVLATGVYLLCLATSCGCAYLLIRAYQRSRTRMLLWIAVSFVFLALNNLSLVADMLIFPDAYLVPVRQATAIAAIAVMVYAFIWEVDK